jgi:hypothetical protein
MKTFDSIYDNQIYNSNTEVIKVFDNFFIKLLEDFQKSVIEVYTLEEVVVFLKV